MKRWRVGTCSMGLSLILVGAALMASTWNRLSAFDALLRWWPVVFIMLGLEILLYLALARKEQPIIFYDIFSILFVGLLCCLCLGFAVATSTGLAAEIRNAIGSEERTVDLPELEQPVPDGIERIVVQSGGALPKIDTTGARELHIFGNYRARFYVGDPVAATAPLGPDDVTTVRTVGNTLYVAIKQLPERLGPNRSYPYAAITLTLPKDVQVELRDASNRPVSR